MAWNFCLNFGSCWQNFLRNILEDTSLNLRQWILSFNPFQPSVEFHIATRHDLQCNKRKVQYLVFSNFLLVLTIFPFWEEDWTLDYNSTEFWDFLKPYVVWQLVSQLVFTILVIITFRFTCYERNIWKENYKFQNIKSTIAGLTNRTHGSWCF